MLSLYCVSHKEVDLRGSGIKVIGVAGYDGDYSDADGESIASRNDCFSELTGLYSVWKNRVPPNQHSALVGFCHYRRFLLPDALQSWLTTNANRPFDNRSKGGEGNFASAWLLESSELGQMFAQTDYLCELEQGLDGVMIVNTPTGATCLSPDSSFSVSTVSLRLIFCWRWRTRCHSIRIVTKTGYAPFCQSVCLTSGFTTKDCR